MIDLWKLFDEQDFKKKEEKRIDEKYAQMSDWGEKVELLSQPDCLTEE